MVNDSPWFKHDYNARRDPKLIRLSRVKGMKGIGIYWSLIEILHEQGGEIEISTIPDIAFELKEDESNVFSVINEFNLFVIDGGCARNARVLQSLQERRNTSESASKNAHKRWAKVAKKVIENQLVNAGALPPHYERNAEKSRVEKNIHGDFVLFLTEFNKIKGAAFRGDEKSKRQFNARINEGFTIDDFIRAITNCKNDKYHIEHRGKYLTPEFITRSDKLQAYLNAPAQKTEQEKRGLPPPMIEGEKDALFSKTNEEFKIWKQQQTK